MANAGHIWKMIVVWVGLPVNILFSCYNAAKQDKSSFSLRYLSEYKQSAISG